MHATKEHRRVTRPSSRPSPSASPLERRDPTDAEPPALLGLPMPGVGAPSTPTIVPARSQVAPGSNTFTRPVMTTRSGSSPARTCPTASHGVLCGTYTRAKRSLLSNSSGSISAPQKRSSAAERRQHEAAHPLLMAGERRHAGGDLGRVGRPVRPARRRRRTLGAGTVDGRAGCGTWQRPVWARRPGFPAHQGHTLTALAPLAQLRWGICQQSNVGQPARSHAGQLLRDKMAAVAQPHTGSASRARPLERSRPASRSPVRLAPRPRRGSPSRRGLG